MNSNLILIIMGTFFPFFLHGATDFRLSSLKEPLKEIENSLEKEDFIKIKGTLVLEAIKKNHLINELFDQDILEWEDEDGRTLMHYAVRECRCIIAIILYLLGFDLNAQDKNGDTPFLFLLQNAEQKKEKKTAPVLSLHTIEMPFQFKKKIALLLNQIEHQKNLSIQEKTILENPHSIINFLLCHSDTFLKKNKKNISAYHFLDKKTLKIMLERSFIFRNKELRDEIIQILIKKRKKDEQVFFYQNEPIPLCRSTGEVFL